MCENEPAYGYLMELQIQHWNARQRLPESLKRATETFHASLMDSQHNDTAQATQEGANSTQTD
jgi:hypothetical protein